MVEKLCGKPARCRLPERHSGMCLPTSVQMSVEPLHPASYLQLKQLIKLHGAERVVSAVYEIEANAING